MKQEWLERTELLIGEEKLQKLQSSNVLVVGLGGVGGYAAEMLCRGGVGSMTIVDADTVAKSNINRQLLATTSTIGLVKAEVLAARLLDINPELKLTTIKQFVEEQNMGQLLDSQKFDYVVDAIDTLSPKVSLITESLKREIPTVSSMGAGAMLDPTQITIADISKTHHCPLAFALRKRLHRIGIREGFYAVFSPEPIRKEAVVAQEERNKKSNNGTISYMPAIFGCQCASVVIRDLIGEM